MEWDEFIFVADKVNPRASETEEYQVADNGFLYRKTIANNETGSYKINQHEITREISFFGAVKGKDCDYTLEFLSLFYKGELKELKLTNFQKAEGEERGNILGEFNEHLKPTSPSWHHKHIPEPVRHTLGLPVYYLFLFFHSVSDSLLRFLLWLK